jgi:ADP-heptose:LPS heptosyltransferase
VILALRALGLGDLLTVVPALRALRRRFLGTPLVLAVPAGLWPLVRRIGAVDRIVAVPPATRRPPADRDLPWSGPPPTVAVNLHGRGPQSTGVLRGLRPGTLWSYGISGGPRWDPDEHEVRRWSRLVEAYGCRTWPADLYLGPPTEHDGPVLVHPGAAEPGRRWPVARYAAVARGIARTGRRVHVTAGPGEHALATELAVRAGLDDLEIVSGMTLTRLADLVRTSGLVVCGDTGIAHLATAYRTPSVLLFGPQSPAQWGPPPEAGRHRVLWHPRPDDAVGEPVRAGTGVGDGVPHPALLRIQPDEVLDAAMRLLRSSR